MTNQGTTRYCINGGDKMGGMFGGDVGGNTAAEKQIRDNEIELEAKKKSLFEERLNLIKSQGAETWQPKIPTPQPNQTNPNGSVLNTKA